MLFRSLRKFSSKHSTFFQRDLIVEKKVNVKPDILGTKFGFGDIATDHMVCIRHCDKRGWEAPCISPLQPIPFHPFNSTLHYALCNYEGMKAYRGSDGSIRLFRPLDNMKRFVDSNLRLAFPAFDPSELLKVIEDFVKIEQDWIPQTNDSTLYIRPFAFSTTNVLGVHKASSSMIMVVASPVGSYFSGEINLSVYEDFWRGSPKSAASYKIGANYAPTVQIGDQLASKGYSQAIWVYEDKILESGATNLFFIIENDEQKLEIVTPPLDGSILPGITRDSVIQLSQKAVGVPVIQRDFTLTEFINLHNKGRVREIFVCGTASVICEVMSLEIRGKVYKMRYPSDRNELLCQRIKTLLTDIQFGRFSHPFSHVIQ